MNVGAPSIPQAAQAASEWVGDHDSSPAQAGAPSSVVHPNFFQEEPTIKPRKSFSALPEIAAAVPAEERAAALDLIREDLGDCTRCALHKGRNSIVFGVGNPAARLMFVGEGPGADEDAQGLPFVGRAGQLLNNMIAAMGLKREEGYIANIVSAARPATARPSRQRPTPARRSSSARSTWSARRFSWRSAPRPPPIYSAQSSRWPVCAGACTHIAERV